MPTRPELRAAKHAIRERWLARARELAPREAPPRGTRRRPPETEPPLIHGLSIGLKVVEGEPIRRLAVRVHVTRKVPLAALARRERIPRSIDGIPTDVVEMPVFRAAATRAALATATATKPCPDPRTRLRPLVPGASAAHPEVPGGSVGGFVRSTRPDDPPSARYLLSCAHVLGVPDQPDLATRVLQPAFAHGGDEDDEVATFARAVPIDPAGTEVDAAIALLDPTVRGRNEVCGLGPLVASRKARLRENVRKAGAITGLTRGRIDDVEADQLVWLPGLGPVQFEDQLLISGLAPTAVFATKGDSGALVVGDSDHAVLGLYFAGPEDGSLALANPIGRVEALLGVRMRVDG